jgi:hypothetical protein
MSVPARLDLVIYQEDTYSRIVQLAADEAGDDPIDITGWTFAAHIRTRPSSAESVVEFDIEVDDAEEGLLTLSLDSPTTLGLSIARPYVWDFQATHDDGTVRTYLRGNVSITGDVTRVEA